MKKVPGTAREIVNHLMAENKLTLKQIAEKIAVSTRTLSRIRKGISPLPETHLNLIILFLATNNQ